MKTKRVISAVLCSTLCLVITLVALAEKSQAAPPVRMYNTAKEKLMAGGAIVGGNRLHVGPQHLLRHGKRRIRFHVDRNAAQSPDV